MEVTTNTIVCCLVRGNPVASTMAVRVCKWCGKLLTGRRSKFCSQVCTSRWHDYSEETDKPPLKFRPISKAIERKYLAVNDTPQLELDELGQLIEQAMRHLSFRERHIIRLRTGLVDGIAHSLIDVGYIFKMTRERVRQIEAKAIVKLQSPKIQSILLKGV